MGKGETFVALQDFLHAADGALQARDRNLAGGEKFRQGESAAVKHQRQRRHQQQRAREGRSGGQNGHGRDRQKKEFRRTGEKMGEQPLHGDAILRRFTKHRFQRGRGLAGKLFVPMVGGGHHVPLPLYIIGGNGRSLRRIKRLNGKGKPGWRSPPAWLRLSRPAGLRASGYDHRRPSPEDRRRIHRPCCAGRGRRRLLLPCGFRA